jgi:hypothetical protein
VLLGLAPIERELVGVKESEEEGLGVPGNRWMNEFRINPCFKMDNGEILVS